MFLLFKLNFFFGKMKVASHQLEYGLYSLECLVMVYVRVYFSTDDKLSCIYINILNKGGYFHGNLQYAFEIFRLSERCDCLLDDFTWERMSDERRLKVVQVNKKSLTPIKMAEI